MLIHIKSLTKKIIKETSRISLNKSYARIEWEHLFFRKSMKILRNNRREIRKRDAILFEKNVIKIKQRIEYVWERERERVSQLESSCTLKRDTKKLLKKIYKADECSREWEGQQQQKTENKRNCEEQKRKRQKWEKFQAELGATWQVFFIFLIFMLCALRLFFLHFYILSYPNNITFCFEYISTKGFKVLIQCDFVESWSCIMIKEKDTFQTKSRQCRRRRLL
jgi:hypothetical protein